MEPLLKLLGLLCRYVHDLLPRIQYQALGLLLILLVLVALLRLLFAGGILFLLAVVVPLAVRLVRRDVELFQYLVVYLLLAFILSLLTHYRFRVLQRLQNVLLARFSLLRFLIGLFFIFVPRFWRGPPVIVSAVNGLVHSLLLLGCGLGGVIVELLRAKVHLLQLEVLQLLDKAFFELAYDFGSAVFLIVDLLDLEDHGAPLLMELGHAIVLKYDLVHLAEDLLLEVLEALGALRYEFLDHRMDGLAYLALNANGHVLLDKILNHGEVILVVFAYLPNGVQLKVEQFLVLLVLDFRDLVVVEVSRHLQQLVDGVVVVRGTILSELHIILQVDQIRSVNVLLSFDFEHVLSDFVELVMKLI